MLKIFLLIKMLGDQWFILFPAASSTKTRASHFGDSLLKASGLFCSLLLHPLIHGLLILETLY